MEHQKAIDILKNLLGKDLLGAEEKEAVFTAIGVLAWISLTKSKIKAIGDKRKKMSSGKGHP